MQNDYWIAVQDATHTAEARRKAAELAAGLGFNETEAGNLGLVVTEAARNLLKHAGGGDLILRAMLHHSQPAVEVLAIDSGPGIADIARCMEDGYSTAGTPGTGLGAIVRLSSCHGIYSQPRKGTALMAQVSKHAMREREFDRPEAGFRCAAVCVPYPGEATPGDAWSCVEIAGGVTRVTVADGLGHGLLAAEAARQAIVTVRDSPTEAGPDLMTGVHLALRPTRGAAVAIADVDRAKGVVRYTGLGNIAGVIIDGDGVMRRLVSHSGTAGHAVGRITEFSYPWTPESTLIMHSDGLGTHWDLDRYPGLISRHPSLIAAVLYRDFRRQRDDVTVVVAQQAGDRH